MFDKTYKDRIFLNMDSLKYCSGPPKHSETKTSLILGIPVTPHPLSPLSK